MEDYSNATFTDTKTGNIYKIQDGKFVCVGNKNDKNNGGSGDSGDKKDDSQKDKKSGGGSGDQKDDSQNDKKPGDGSNDKDKDQNGDKDKNDQGDGGSGDKDGAGEDKGDKDGQSKDKDKGQKGDQDKDGKMKDKNGQDDDGTKDGDNSKDDEDSDSSKAGNEKSTGYDDDWFDSDYFSSREEQLAAIQKLKDGDTLQKLFDERNTVQARLNKEKEDREREEQRRKLRRDGLNGEIPDLKKSLYRFMKQEVETYEDSSWGAQNRRYMGTPEVLRPGVEEKSKRNIPVINVYIDCSGSFGEPDRQATRAVLSVLNKYELQKLLKINYYYFTDRFSEISTTPYDSGGTSGIKIVEHIKQTRPGNVFICTDSDIDDIDEVVTVQGAVWMMFRGGAVSNNLKTHIRGKKLNYYAKY